MIHGDDPYGWGVFSIPMPHEVRPADPAGMPLFRLLTRDIPWRPVLFSVGMTCLVCIVLLFFGPREPTALARPETTPVEVTVMLPPEVRELPPPAAVTAPAPAPVKPRPVTPPPPAPKVVRPTPPPPPPTPVVARETLKPPPEPRAVREPKPVEAPLPQPTQLAQRRAERVTPSSALPQRKAEIAVPAQETVAVAPSAAAYRQDPRPVNSADLPKQAASFRTEAPAAGLAVQPAPDRFVERTPASPSRPRSSAAAFGSPAETKLAPVDTGHSPTRYKTPSAGSAPPAPTRPQTVATGRGGDTAVIAPQTTGGRTDLGTRTVAAPAAERSRDSFGFAGAASSEPLSGPAATVRNVSAAPSSPALPASGSFDFLDGIAPSALDQSVLISLNRLNTCRDPGEETRLKTRLAALLSKPARCRAGGVIFDIRNPESAYSIHIDLYNYEQRTFRDRCDALNLAVQSCDAGR